jgi:glyoxylase-like metal-dependent hydrolase (beta-lactamase superfamily II)
MQVNSPSPLHNNSTEKTNQIPVDSSAIVKKPRLICENIFAFPPNRETLGGTAYLILSPEGNILIDSPLWPENNLEFCQQQGGVKYLFLTHRGGISKQINKIQQNLDCQLLIQEQEAYLLPNLQITTFSDQFQLNRDCQVFWTPGHSPGSSCLYYALLGGVLFTGRHLLPNQQGECIPWRMKKTFHWRRQLNSQKKISDRLFFKSLNYICPGANTGYLKGQGVFKVENW